VKKRFNNDWTIRIYHDDTIDQNIKCKLECLKDDEEEKDAKYLNNVDFCRITRMPIISKEDRDYWRRGGDYFAFYAFASYSWWNAKYLHGMKWRWFPIGDSFVDYFMSRDSDTSFIAREYEAVKDWLARNTLMHSMRDHPYHNVPMLGGLWGMIPKLNRNFSNLLFRRILTSDDTTKTSAHTKGEDQTFLHFEFWPNFLTDGNYTVHASFFCSDFGEKSLPFPLKRKGSCYVGVNYDECEYESTPDLLKYPEKCKPATQMKTNINISSEWIYC
jgi:hypothetical protein